MRGWLLLDVVPRLCRELGDDTLTHRCIPTEPRVGYRMERPDTVAQGQK